MRLPKTSILFLPILLPLLLSGQPLFPVKKDKKWGLMNAEGQIVLQPVYDAIGEFKQFGYAVMQRNGKVGMLSNRGKEIVPPRYHDLKALDSTLISVLDGKEWKVINLAGKVILQTGYERVEVMKSGDNSVHLAFMVNKKWGIVDVQGRVIAVPRYDEVSLLDNVPDDVPGIYFQTKNDNLLGLLLSNGFEALAPQAEEIEIYNPHLFFFKKLRKWGAVNHCGQEVLSALYDHFSKLSDNFIKLIAANKSYLFSMYYNALVSNGEYEAYYPFSDEFALCKRNRLLGLIDHCGTLILDTRYNEIQAYDGQLFRANLDGKWGIVSLDNKELIPFEYDYIAPMRYGMCILIQNRRIGAANSRGEIVITPAFDRIDMQEGQAKAYRKDKLTMFNFDAAGRLQEENDFGKHFTIKITKETDPRPQRWGNFDTPYQLDKFEWFYSPKHDKWGLRRLDNGVVQIEPAFHEVRVEKELGLTIVGIEMMQEQEFDRTSYRFEMAYGLVKNDTGLLVREVDLVDIRLSDFDEGLPVARCIFLNGRQGLVNRIGKIIRKDFVYVGEFHDGVARVSTKGKLSARLKSPGKPFHQIGELQEYLNAHLAPVTLSANSHLPFLPPWPLPCRNHGHGEIGVV